MAEAARIFVSHSHADNAWTRPFVEALRQAGADVWYDEHNLGYGVLDDEIERELRARPIFLVVLSPAAVARPFVRREMAAAINLQDQDPTRIILPVMADKAEVPLLWRAYRRISGPDDAGLAPSEAAGRVVHALALVPAEAASAPIPPAVSETAEAAWERGEGLYAQSRYEEALAAFERALELDPTYTHALIGKGSALSALGRLNGREQEALEVVLVPRSRIGEQMAMPVAGWGVISEREDHLRDQARLSPPTPSDAPKGRPV
jgi:tetratricopeptide (TPR) repeat protein